MRCTGLYFSLRPLNVWINFKEWKLFTRHGTFDRRGKEKLSVIHFFIQATCLKQLMTRCPNILTSLQYLFKLEGNYVDNSRRKIKRTTQETLRRDNDEIFTWKHGNFAKYLRISVELRLFLGCAILTHFECQVLGFSYFGSVVRLLKEKSAMKSY